MSTFSGTWTACGSCGCLPGHMPGCVKQHSRIAGLGSGAIMRADFDTPMMLVDDEQVQHERV